MAIQLYRLTFVSEIIAYGGRRHHWGAPSDLRIIKEALDDNEGVSIVACRNSVVSNLMYRGRPLMLKGKSFAVASNNDVTNNRQVLETERRIRRLERRLGRRTVEVEIPK